MAKTNVTSSSSEKSDAEFNADFEKWKEDFLAAADFICLRAGTKIKFGSEIKGGLLELDTATKKPLKKLRTQIVEALKLTRKIQKMSALSFSKEHVALLQRLGFEIEGQLHGLSTLERQKKKRGTKALPPELAIDVLRCLIHCRGSKTRLNKIKKFLMDGGECEQYLTQNFELPLPISFSVFAEDPGQSTKWANDLKARLTKSILQWQLRHEPYRDLDKDALWAALEHEPLVKPRRY